MSFLPSLPENATLFELVRRFPEFARRQVPANSQVMRGDSPLTPGERETIAAYVSSLNACEYCVGSHAEAAKAFGVPEELLAQLMEDVDAASVDPKLKPLLRFVNKLTLEPARMSQADADAVYAVGWDEEALFSAVLVCCTFNFMNRLVDGTGLIASQAQAVGSGRLLHDQGYDAILSMLEK